MAKKILARITNNALLKILAVVLAFFLWMVVVNVNNPQTTASFTATVEVKNDSIITENGKVYAILDNSDSVRFTVSGPRSIVESLSVSDFQVVADMNKINMELGLIPVDVTALRYASKLSISVKNTNIRVSIEDIQAAQFVVSAYAEGTPKNGYAAGEIVCEPSTITITGPQSVIERISKVVAPVQVDGVYADRTQTVIPTVLDGNGDVISSSSIQLEPSSVQVTAHILETKEVSINVETTGRIKEGYSLVSLKCVPSKVVVKGDRDALSAFSSITIPANEIDLSNATGKVEKSINITQYLPEGVNLVDEDQGTVIVTADIEKLSTKTFKIPVSAIDVLNLNTLYKVQFNQTEITITVMGKAEALNNLTAEALGVYIDLKGYEEGIFNVTVSRNEIEGIIDSEVIQISGEIVKKDSETGTGVD